MKYRVTAKMENGTTCVSFADDYDRATQMETHFIAHQWDSVEVAPEHNEEEVLMACGVKQGDHDMAVLIAGMIGAGVAFALVWWALGKVGLV